MRRFYLPFTVMLTCAFLCMAFSANAVTLRESNTILSSGSGGVFLSAFGDKKLTSLQLAPSSVRSEYTMSNKVHAACVYNSRVYALTQSPTQKDVCILTRMCNGKIEDELYFHGLKLSGNTALAVTKNRFYATDYRENVHVFDLKGNKLHTASFKAYDLISYSGGVLCLGNKAVNSLSGQSESRVLNCGVTRKICAVHKSYAADGGGNIYQLGKGRIFSTGAAGLYKTCFTSDSVISLNGRTLEKFSYTGEKAGSVELDSAPLWVTSYNNRIMTINSAGADFTYSVGKESDLFKKPAVSSGEQGGGSAKSVKGFKNNGKYIYLDSSVTVSAFKKSVGGLNVDFPTKYSGNIGTNTDVIIGKRGYQFVIRGDLTGEGNVNLNDERAMFKRLLGVEKLRGAFKKAADLNGDGKVSNADLVLLSRKID